MSKTYIGFYEELQKLQHDYPDDGYEDFEFLNDEIHIDNKKINIYDYLHGLCDYFAISLIKQFNYEMQAIYNENNELVHAYCTHKNKQNDMYFIDVRGCTTDFQTFISEFEDFITISEDEPIDIRQLEPTPLHQKHPEYTNTATKIIQTYKNHYIPK